VAEELPLLNVQIDDIQGRAAPHGDEDLFSVGSQGLSVELSFRLPLGLPALVGGMQIW